MVKVYHATLDNNLSSLRMKLVNKEFWFPGRDFGKGFYMTEDIDQAREWALMRGQRHEAIVLELEFSYKFNDKYHQIFNGTTRAWSNCIYDNRVIKKDSNHFKVISGPMADNGIKCVVKKCRKDSLTRDWFFRQIRSSNIGSQITVTDEVLGNTFIKLLGWQYPTAKEDEWGYVKYDSYDSGAI